LIQETNPLSCLIRQGARLMLQRALEEEVTYFLGRGHYKRYKNHPFRGYRNGYEPTRLNLAEGKIEIFLPQVRQTKEKFRSSILNHCRRRTEALESLIPQLYIKGLSVRDIEDILRSNLKLNRVSKSIVSNLSNSLEEDFNKWRNRDLSTLDILYLFIDGIYLKLRQDSKEEEVVLTAYGITSAGNKVLLHITQANKESYDVCKSFIHDMKERGLNEPLLVVFDGNPGLKKAIKQCFPTSLYQRCQVHKMRNILAKLPKDIKAQMKSLIHKAFRAKTYEDGLKIAKGIIGQFKDRFPSAMECLEKDLEETLTCLKFPEAHRARIRSTNALERLFGEVKRRTKVIGRFPTETSCLKLVYAVLIDASKCWHGVKMTVEILQELAKLEKEIRSQSKIEIPSLQKILI
jgi:transposase-like protein